MKKVLMLGNGDPSIYNFRRELIERMIQEEYEVYVSLPYGPRVADLQVMGCKFIETPVNGRSTNPIQDMKLFLKYIDMLKEVNPDIVLSYTVKPNVYGGIACRIMNIPYICNVTGLGSGYLNGGLIKKIIKVLSKISFKKANKVFFQNSTEMSIFINEKIVNSNYSLIPGSGVNLKQYNLLKYPSIKENITFNFIARIIKDKGIDEYLEAAKIIKSRYPNVVFNVIGEIGELKYKKILEEYEEKEIIIYHGFQVEIMPYIKKSSCTVNPSYSEGMSNVLLESAACGRPVIASNIAGCKEIINDKITGYKFQVKNVEDLVKKIELFIKLPYYEKVNMGLLGREKVGNDFDRNIIVTRYMNLIKLIEKSILNNEDIKSYRSKYCEI